MIQKWYHKEEEEEENLKIGLKVQAVLMMSLINKKKENIPVVIVQTMKTIKEEDVDHQVK